ncbi:alpha/beta hydrolase family protein [Dyadobacter jejuensis]|nr:prolyl oligopeptidase family serine peptidase [Dyadobacter jejuensis]
MDNFKSKCFVPIFSFVLLLCGCAVDGTAQSNAVHDANQNRAGNNEGFWDSKVLFGKPDSKSLQISSGVQSLLFKSVDYKGKSTEVFAYYSDPDMLNGKTSQKKFPGVVLLHGGGGKAFQEWVEKWAAEGYAAIAIDFGGKDGNGNRLENAGPAQGAEEKFTNIANGPLTDVWTYHAVASSILAHSWLRAQPKVDSSMTFVTGISWGGYLTCIVGSVDHRFKAAVPVYGCGYYGESDVFKKDLNQLSGGFREKWLQYFDPSVYLPHSQVKFLFINGNKDRFYNVIPYSKSYSLVSEKNRRVCIKPDMLHSHPRGWEPLEIRSFFDHLAYGYADLPSLNDIRMGEGSISASYNAPVTLANASFYYTSDTLSTNENRKWQSVKAEIDPDSKKISCKMPEEGFAYGFFSIKDHRSVSASSEFVINGRVE